MLKKIHRQKYMIFLRYGYIFFFILAFAKEYKKIDIYGIVYLLCYVINNQLRYFIILPKNKVYILISLTVEIILSAFLYSFGGNFGGLIFISILIDIIYMFNSKWSVIYIISVMLCIISKGNLDSVMSFSIAALPLFVLLIRVKDEEVRKVEAQDLYDKLKENDEKLKRAHKELEAYANTIEEITLLRERNRISREIHDNVGHALSTIIIQLGAIEKVCINNAEEASKMTKNLAEFTKESMERVRAAVRAMKPREFEEYEGMIAVSEMTKNFEKLTGIEVKLKVSDNIWKLNSDQTMVIYRITQEFLSNSLKHGRATEVKIFLNFLQGSLRVHFKDNGCGCLKVVTGLGLQGIKERVAVWGGNMEYFTKEQQGFELIVTMDKYNNLIGEING